MSMFSPENEADQNTYVTDNILNPSTFFPWPEQDKFLGTIQHLADNSEAVILLKGQRGAGKTTLIYRMQSGAPDHWLLCRIDANPMLNQEQLLYKLANQIGLDTREYLAEYDFFQIEYSKEQENFDYTNRAEFDIEYTQLMPLSGTNLANALHANFAKLRLQGQLPIVFVDDAQLLPINTLEVLLELHSRLVEGLIPFALIMLTEHKPILETIPNIQCLELPRLSLEQINAYTQHFLKFSTDKPILTYDQEQLTKLHQASTGLPGKMNMFIRKIWREELIFEPTHKSFILRKILLFIAGVLGIGILGLAILTIIESPYVKEYLEKIIQTNTKTSQDSETDWTSNTLPLPPPNLVSNKTSVKTPPDTKQTPNKPEPITSNEPLIPAPNTRPSLGTPDKTGATSQNVVDTNHSESWVTKKPPTTYTLQLAIVTDAVRSRRYIAQHNIAAKAAAIKITRNNQRPVYYILYGTYKTRGDAIKALKKLPTKLRQEGAWPRPLGDIQSKLN